MPEEPRKLSEIMKEMAETLFRDPRKMPSSEAAHAALLFANVAWNETVGIAGARQGYRNVWQMLEAENPELWNELKSNDIDALIEGLVRYKNIHFPGDGRRILTCGIPNGNVHVEWLEPVKAGVDSKWEMHLYGLVRTGAQQEAISYLETTRNMSRSDAAKRVAEIAKEMGVS